MSGIRGGTGNQARLAVEHSKKEQGENGREGTISSEQRAFEK